MQRITVKATKRASVRLHHREHLRPAFFLQRQVQNAKGLVSGAMVEYGGLVMALEVLLVG